MLFKIEELNDKTGFVHEVQYRVEMLGMVGSIAKGYNNDKSDVDYGIVVTMITHPNTLLNYRPRTTWDRNKSVLLGKMLHGIKEVMGDKLPNDIFTSDVKILEISQFFRNLVKQGVDDLVWLYGGHYYVSDKFKYVMESNLNTCFTINSDYMHNSVNGSMHSYRKQGSLLKSTWLWETYEDVIHKLNTQGNLLGFKIRRDKDSLRTTIHKYGETPLSKTDVLWTCDYSRINHMLRLFYDTDRVIFLKDIHVT